jgi:hypothetical protein
MTKLPLPLYLPNSLIRRTGGKIGGGGGGGGQTFARLLHIPTARPKSYWGAASPSPPFPRTPMVAIYDRSRLFQVKYTYKLKIFDYCVFFCISVALKSVKKSATSFQIHLGSLEGDDK